VSNPNIGKTVGQIVKRLRKELDMTQQEVADRAGMTASRISQLEQCMDESCRVSTLLGLCEAFKVTPNWFLGFGE